MLIKLKLYPFGTLYFWLFVLEVLTVLLPHSIGGNKIADKVGGASLLLKPYPYQLFDDTDELLNARSGGGAFAAIPVWQTWMAKDKPQQQQQQHLTTYPFDSGGPLSSPMQTQSAGSDSWQMDDSASGVRQDEYHPVPSSEIDFEMLSDYDKYLIRNAIWLPASPKYLNEGNNKLQHQRLTLQPLTKTPANIRYGKAISPLLFMDKRGDKQSTTSFLDELRKDVESNNDDGIANDNENNNDDIDDVNADAVGRYGNANGIGILVGHKDGMDHYNVENNDVNDGSETIDEEYTPKDNDTKSNKSHINQTPTKSLEHHQNSNNSANKKEDEEVNNYATGHNKDKELEYIDIHDRKRAKLNSRNKKKPKTLASTPFLPAVSGGAMTNLGKFFRDLSKNVQFSENYQWTSAEQNLLEGNPTLGNLHHHLSEPHLKTDQAGEWIKTIRFYRPSQKIRSLVAMNPHGQWAHGSQFLDPNYMWVGLGK